MNLLKRVIYLFSLNPQTTPANPQYQHVVQRITAVTDYRLLNYAKSRGIPEKVLNRFCREIRYQSPKGIFSSIGFKSESEGWELRNEGFKGCLGEKDFTLIGNMNATSIRVFEGFMDFLSYVVLYKFDENNAFLVLNSLSFIPRVIIPLQAFTEGIFLYLDNDESGRKATERLKKRIAARTGLRAAPLSRSQRFE